MAWLKRAGSLLYLFALLLFLVAFGSLFAKSPSAGTVGVDAGSHALVYWEGESDWLDATVLEVDDKKFAVLRYAALQDRIERVASKDFIDDNGIWLLLGSERLLPSALEVLAAQQRATEATAERTISAALQRQEQLKEDGGETWLGNAKDLHKLQPSSRGGSSLQRSSSSTPLKPAFADTEERRRKESQMARIREFGVFWKEYNKIYPADMLKRHSNGSCLVQYRDGTIELVHEEWRLMPAM